MEFFYFFVPYSENEDSWIEFLSPLIFFCIGAGFLSALVFVFTRTREPNLKKQNRYWFLVSTIFIVLAIIGIWFFKNSVEDAAATPITFELLGVITAIVGSCIYTLIFYYIFTWLIRLIPKSNVKRFFPSFVIPHASKLK